MSLRIPFLLVLTIPGLRAESPKALHDLFDSEWNYEMERQPVRASQLGDRRFNDRWPDISLNSIAKDDRHAVDVLARLHSIDRSRLSPEDQINYDLFERHYRDAIEEHRYRWYLIPLNQREGIQTRSQLAESLRFSTRKDYEDWIARLQSFGAYMDQTIALMREGIRARMLLPKVVLERLPAQIAAQIVSAPERSPFYKPFTRFPRDFSETERAGMTERAGSAIRSSVIPAFERLQKFVQSEYLPASFDRVGVWQTPEGDKLYAFFARKYTTTDLTPQQIHETGLREVARIREQMGATMRHTGFRGDLPEFFHFLRTDPRFFYKTPAELLTAYRALAKSIDPNLVKIFRTLPRAPYGVLPIPDEIAPDTTTAYYHQLSADGSRAGTFYVNLYRPEVRPKWEMPALALHESVPGHHLQIALSYEQPAIPNFRRYGEFTAFVEGWGLYAESLGEDMGLYDDPYAKFGQLTYEMWRAVRLVVDTGIHSLHWDREKAIRYFMENAAKTELDVTNEIDRYIAWPGQALAYKIGELKFKELRDRAEQARGAAFDLREFHDVVLCSGALPLNVLERRVDAWINKAGAR